MSEEAAVEIRHVFPNYHGAYAVITHPADRRGECCDYAEQQGARTVKTKKEKESK